MIMYFIVAFLHLDALQGAGEARTELYLTYSEGAPQPATKQGAKSLGGVSGRAGKQAEAVRGCD
jgi:hypothetical protein